MDSSLHGGGMGRDDWVGAGAGNEEPLTGEIPAPESWWGDRGDARRGASKTPNQNPQNPNLN